MKLPSIGPKTASRLAYHVLKMEKSSVDEFAVALRDVKTQLAECSVCCNITDVDPCPICTDSGRSDRVLCVVQESRDVAAMERTHEFSGKYHVLHGSISPMEGIGPNDIRIRELVQRVADTDVEEIIVATNPNVEGEATAMYISKLLKPFSIRISRLAHGLPVGGDLEYADEVTLAKALEGRRNL